MPTLCLRARLMATAAVSFSLLVACRGGEQVRVATPTATASATPTSTATVTPTVSSTPTGTATGTTTSTATRPAATATPRPDTPVTSTPGGSTPPATPTPETASPGPLTPPSGRRLDRAPVHEVSLAVVSGTTRLQVRFVTGLPGGCAQYLGTTVERSGNTITLVPWNTMPTALVACTAIYGYQTHLIDLGEQFVSGTTYTVLVGDQRQTITAP